MKPVGRIVLFLGCMWSYKTSSLVREYNRYTHSNKSCLLIKYSKDQRYSKEHITTHDGTSIPAVSCTKLNEIIDTALKYDVVLVDEGQFFEDIYIICDLLANKGKIVIVAALDGDYRREPFGQIHRLIPRAEKVKKLSAVCMQCKEQTAYFTKRITADETIELIGGSDTYKSVCRVCYFE